MLPLDYVDPEVLRRQVEAALNMTPSQRFQRMLDLNEFVKQTQLTAIRAAHPDADEHEIRMRLASRWVRPELLKAAFGWDVAEKGY